MAKEYELVSTIIADDIRKEESGKEIIIGTYTSTLIAESFPLLMPTVAFRFEVKVKKKHFERVVTQLISPEGKTIYSAEGVFSAGNTKYSVSFFARHTPLILPISGEYRLMLGLDDEPTVASVLAALTVAEAKELELIA